MQKNILLILFGISGMTALIYEVTWIRPLSLVFGTTIYAVSTIIAAFILGLALGSWLAGKYTDSLKNPLRHFSILQIAIGFYGIFLLPIFGTLPGFYFEIYNLTYPNQPLFMFIQVVLSMAIISIPATMMGTTLPLMFKEYSKTFSSIGKDVGKLDASNSIGAVIGTLAAGFLMIPLLGIQTTLIVTALLNIGLGLSILTVKKFLKFRYIAAIAIATILLFTIVPNYDIKTLNLGIFAYNNREVSWEQRVSFLEKEKVLFYKESPYATVLVVEDSGLLRLTINGKTQCSTIPFEYNGLEKLASLPFEVFEYNYGKPENALNIGMGCGTTSKWLSEKTDTTTIEIDPVVAQTTDFFFDKIDHKLIIDDGRNWLARNEKKYDIITSEPSDPFENRGSLFTQEYMTLVKTDLSENGIVSQWVPVFEWTPDDINIFYNTFHSVFPYVYIYQMDSDNAKQLVFLGSKKPLEIPENELYLLSSAQIPTFESVLNTDDKPVLEFSTSLNIYDD